MRHRGVYHSGTIQKRTRENLSGSTRLWLFLLFAFWFVLGGWYLYSVNHTAVAGYHIRALEKEIHQLKQENAALRVTEADLRSLYRIEASDIVKAMLKADELTYLEERGPVALR